MLKGSFGARLGLFGVSLLVLLASACGPAATPAPTATATSVPPTATAEATTTSVPTPTEVVDHCIQCHTDKDQLIQTAKVEEEAGESESEGVG